MKDSCKKSGKTLVFSFDKRLDLYRMEIKIKRKADRSILTRLAGFQKEILGHRFSVIDFDQTDQS